ncbi:MAG TPA: hypothetical protein VF070_24480, partial [Streptosporangiaceae bacterium]
MIRFEYPLRRPGRDGGGRRWKDRYERGGSTGDEDAMIAGHAAGDQEPGWLDDDLPPDPEGDDREWPGDLAGVVAESDVDEAEQAEIRWRLLAAGVETGFAHSPGGPVIPGVQDGPGGGFGQGQPW